MDNITWHHLARLASYPGTGSNAIYANELRSAAFVFLDDINTFLDWEPQEKRTAEIIINSILRYVNRKRDIDDNRKYTADCLDLLNKANDNKFRWRTKDWTVYNWEEEERQLRDPILTEGHETPHEPCTCATYLNSTCNALYHGV